MARLTRPPLRVWIWTAATLALVVVATLLWRGSDAAATSSTTAAPADVPPGAPAGAVSEAWSAAADPLPGNVVAEGRVLVGSPHGVRALDPVTGEEAWHYTRGNAALCGLTVTDGVAVAVFRTEDRCDEAVALDAGTGVRAWTRNVDFRPEVTLTATDRIVLAATPTGIVTLDPTGSGIRWRYAPPEGCEFLQSAAGDAGVAVLQRCAGSSALQLRLMDGFDGDLHWTRDLPASARATELVGADLPVAVRVDDEVQLLSSADGTLLTTLPADPGAAVRQAATGTAVLVLTDGTLTALEPGSARPLWSVPATGLPGGAATTEDGAPALPVPTAGGIVHLDPATGTELGSTATPELPDGAVATVVGPVVVLAHDGEVRAYR
ncbi:PQQ-binding-like beta-propeller repeat protein [Blastococcus sp. BMG 814]|uniref:PQQ-binding-like beta-propeller repeat protein n=1 Tax=Blastococcus carthaginiensis TaxID=3050034 RepID=A0ABT9IB02_9ACTN|nr:PQQ-binding-like beta-propeller repeat protein [Blastococcus carthaginiensis]MDP5182751.1 PQQ-binding-like beta-propeller repeat protein [Blastococcus carthaginiensis]